MRGGRIVWQPLKSGLFGRVMREKSTLSPYAAGQNLRFAGQYHDEETGLHYNTLRYYDPESGRFTQPDPVGLAGGINLYAYAPNPLSWIDPLGLSKTQDMVNDAHDQLDAGSQSRKTTAIGVDSNGNYHIASNNDTVPRSQRVWAEKNGVNVVNGVGHAEETIMNNIPDVEHIDASRPVCIDCENMMKNKGVTTDTPMSGKKSRNRMGKGGC